MLDLGWHYLPSFFVASPWLSRFRFLVDAYFWRKLDMAGEIPRSRTSHASCIDQENGLIYILYGSGKLFGHTNLEDIFEFSIRM